VYLSPKLSSHAGAGEMHLAGTVHLFSGPAQRVARGIVQRQLAERRTLLPPPAVHPPPRLRCEAKGRRNSSAASSAVRRWKRCES
jgi:hypothetical protein